MAQNSALASTGAVDGRGKRKREDLVYNILQADVKATDFESFFPQLEILTNCKLLTRTQAIMRRDGIMVKSYKCEMYSCRCPAVFRVLLDKELMTATVEASSAHAHAAPKTTQGMTYEQKSFVRNLISSFCKPDRIDLLLRKEPRLAPYPDVEVIRNYNRNHGKMLRRQSFNDSLAGFVDFGNSLPLKTTELDTIACIGSQVDPVKGEFRFAFASPRMLRLLLAYKNGNKYYVRCTDGTYKLNCEAYTTLVYGIVNLNHHYHPAAVAVVNNEYDFDHAWFYDAVETAVKKLEPGYDLSMASPYLYTMQDFAGAIRNGQQRAMTTSSRVLKQLMCWSHTLCPVTHPRTTGKKGRTGH